MAWPTPQDYNEALQSPQTSFSDPELRAGHVETDRLGLPRPRSGRFAIVYQMRCPGRNWAVRCFQSEVADQQQRYAAIDQHLKGARLPYTVGFEFLPQGIRIKGQWYPVLKMEWSTGQQLNTYVEQHLHDPAELMRLASSWMTMTESLRKASLAHGDLQDGNVLVVSGALKLIDYDGMFVPALAGRVSNESGHRNYQHPNRTAADYGLYLDNFSDWVIYVSIVALAIDPTLWTRLKSGDECLLFRKDDFVPQSSSGALTVLAQHSDARLRGLASIFEPLLYLLPEQVPALATNTAFDPTSLGQTSAPPSAANGASWLDDHIKRDPVAKAAQVSPSAAPSDVLRVPLPTASPNWILDFITPPTERRTFENPVSRLRFILATLMLAMLSIPMLGNITADLVGDSVLATLLCCLPFLVYRRDPVVRERSEALAREREQKAILSDHEQAVRGNEAGKVQLRAAEAKSRAELDQQHDALLKQEEKEKQRAAAELKATTDSITVRVSNLNRTLQKVQSDYQAGLARSNQQIAQINQTQASEMASALQPLQRQFVQDYMRGARVDTARISGIGAKMAARLAAHGYVTAADVNWNVGNVSGIGNSKASALMGWRQVVEGEAKQRMPTRLSRAQADAITTKFEAQRQRLTQSAEAAKTQFGAQERLIKQQNASAMAALDGERASAQRHCQQQTQAIMGRYLPQHNQVTQQKAKLKSDYDKRCSDVDQETALVRKTIYDQNWQLAKARQELDAYEWVTFSQYIRYLCLNRLHS